MSLKSEMELHGEWLFRRRSYLPLIGVPVLVAVLANMVWPFGSLGFHEVWEFICLAISFGGLGVRISTVGFVPEGTSGRNTKGQIATVLNTTGIYSTVRHPLYLGNYLIGLGAVMVPFEWWLPLLYTTAYYLYYERIMYAEEAFLQRKFGEQFDQWASRTPAFIPRISQWNTPARRFSWRTVLRREYSGLFMVILLHTAIEVVEHWFIEDRLTLEAEWVLLFAAGCAVYLVLRTLKKRTQILVWDET